MVSRLGLLLLLPALATAWQERSTSTYVYDSEGRRVLWSSSASSDSRHIQTTTTINGRKVPQEQVDEKVLKDAGGVKVVERTTRRFDSNGQALPPEKTVIEETALPGGGSTTSTTTYRADLNGRFAASERTVSKTSKSGDTTCSEVIVQRPTLNGSFEPVEKRVSQTSGTAQASETQETVYRVDANRAFQEAARTVVTQKTVNGTSLEETAEYESASTGSLQLSRQTVSMLVKSPDGSETRQVDVYGVAAPGRPATGGQLQLRERQMIERQTLPGGGTVETLSVARPSLTSSNELGPLKKISETVCQGACVPPEPKNQPQQQASGKN